MSDDRHEATVACRQRPRIHSTCQPNRTYTRGCQGRCDLITTVGKSHRIARSFSSTAVGKYKYLLPPLIPLFATITITITTTHTPTNPSTIITMHLITASTILALASAAAAAPQLDKPISPPWQQSKSFTLVANVTGADLTPSVQNYVLTSYHVGAGQARAVLVNGDTARLFYLNGTAEEVRYNRASVLSSGGTPVRLLPQKQDP
jgi:hypothetical protein